MGASSCSDIKNSLSSLYLEDPRLWLVGFNGGKQGPARDPFTGLARVLFPLSVVQTPKSAPSRISKLGSALETRPTWKSAIPPSWNARKRRDMDAEQNPAVPASAAAGYESTDL